MLFTSTATKCTAYRHIIACSDECPIVLVKVTSFHDHCLLSTSWRSYSAPVPIFVLTKMGQNRDCVFGLNTTLPLLHKSLGLAYASSRAMFPNMIVSCFRVSLPYGQSQVYLSSNSVLTYGIGIRGYNLAEVLISVSKWRNSTATHG